MKGSITRLILQKHSDIKNLKNWRPFPLLNIDYKIISKVLTSHLAKVIESIVHSDHSIVSNFTLLHDIIDLQETDECPIT